MTASAQTHGSRRALWASQVSAMISQGDSRQDPDGRRVIYVLGFGLAGAILTNAAVFGYFALFYVSS